MTKPLLSHRGKITVALGAIALIFLTAGCASFKRDWNKAHRSGSTRRGLEGAWEGYWKSDRNGHRGRLRCVVTSLGEDRYRAKYHATYWKVTTFTYSVTLTAEQTAANSFSFAGEADLGKLAGGVYRYRGTVRGDKFSSTYASRFDRGIFEMTRR